MTFRFADPLFLALLALPLLLFLWRLRGVFRPALGTASPPLNKERRTSGRSGSYGGAGVSRVTPALSSLPLVRGLPFAVLVLFTLALARPQEGNVDVEYLSEGINIILAVDLSESMQEEDFRIMGRDVNRLRAIKAVVRDFVGTRLGDRIGMVVFGSEAYTQLPLTRDYEVILDVLDRLEIGAAGRNTAIGDALGISLKRIRDVESLSNVVILLTDGVHNSGELSPLEAAKLLAKEGVRVYTIGVGSRHSGPDTAIDEESLKEIARRTEGRYFRAEDTTGLEEIYDIINQLEKNEVEMVSHADFRDLYPLFLIPALALMLLWVVLTSTRFLTLP